MKIVSLFILTLFYSTLSFGHESRLHLIDGQDFSTESEYCGVHIELDKNEIIVEDINNTRYRNSYCRTRGQLRFGTCEESTCEIRFNVQNRYAGETLNGWRLNILPDGNIIIKNYIWAENQWQLANQIKYRQ